jgi:hypothetical protein
MESLRGSQRIEDGQNLLKISAPLSLMKASQIIPLSARFISLDSTFKKIPGF